MFRTAIKLPQLSNNSNKKDLNYHAFLRDCCQPTPPFHANLRQKRAIRTCDLVFVFGVAVPALYLAVRCFIPFLIQLIGGQHV